MVYNMSIESEEIHRTKVVRRTLAKLFPVPAKAYTTFKHVFSSTLTESMRPPDDSQATEGWTTVIMKKRKLNASG